MMQQGLLKILVLAVGLSGTASQVHAGDMCLDCHEPEAGDTSQSSLAMLSRSIHAGFSCTDCHEHVDMDDHPSEAARGVNCASCHEEIAEEYNASVHHRKHDEGNAKAPFCYDCHGTHNIRSKDDPEAPITRLHIPQMCARCHSTVQGVLLLQVGQQAPYEAYKNSIHGKLILEEGIEGAAVCSDCHEPHRQLRKFNPEAKIFKSNIPATCGQCHGEITEVYDASVHGQAVISGNFDAPACTDCHSEHGILPPDEQQSRVYGANISRTTCLNCHATLRLADDLHGGYKTREFGYRDSYHGAASRSGVVEVANCASCHGVHDIFPSSDPRSSVNKANLPHTCGKCHPNATENFAQGDIHSWEAEEAGLPASWVRRIYIWLIVLVLGGMFIHNAVLFSYYLRHRHHPPQTGVEYLRFNRNERWQHWILAAVFIGLVITGFAFRFPDSWWSSWWVGSSEGFQTRDFMHRLFGGLFAALMLYNIFYTFFTRRGRLLVRHLWPTLEDAKGLVQNIRFHLGWSSDRMPVRGLFDYAEKAEYWALVWGSWVMLLTGIPMWFENWALSFMPLWMLDICRAIHFYEAILASAAIVIWHFYFVIFDPENYPLNMSMITGRAKPRHGMTEIPDAGAGKKPAAGPKNKASAAEKSEESAVRTDR